MAWTSGTCYSYHLAVLVRVVDVPEERGAQDAEGEEEAEGEAEEEGGEDGVGDEHGVDVEAPALLAERPLVLNEDTSLEQNKPDNTLKYIDIEASFRFGRKYVVTINKLI